MIEFLGKFFDTAKLNWRLWLLSVAIGAVRYACMLLLCFSQNPCSVLSQQFVMLILKYMVYTYKKCSKLSHLHQPKYITCSYVLCYVSQQVKYRTLLTRINLLNHRLICSLKHWVWFDDRPIILDSDLCPFWIQLASRLSWEIRPCACQAFTELLQALFLS